MRFVEKDHTGTAHCWEEKPQRKAYPQSEASIGLVSRDLAVTTYLLGCPQPHSLAAGGGPVITVQKVLSQRKAIMCVIALGVMSSDPQFGSKNKSQSALSVLQSPLV